MDKELLVQLINDNFSIREIAEKTNRPPTTVRFWMKKFNLKTNLLVCNKHGLAKKPKHLLGVYKDIWYCKKCGESDKNNFYKDTKSRCAKCSREEVFNRYRENKRLAVEYKGGKCVLCGYKKCLAAMDFHHRDPSKKDPNWKKMKSWSLDKIKSELDKCDLVCRNCHSEIHYLEKYKND